MNKLSLSILAGAMVFLGACSSEEPGVNSPNGGYQDGKVTFTVSAPGIFSRSVADGLSATELNYAVFDEDGNFIFQEESAATFTNKETTVAIPLVLGKTYKVAFFAKSPTAPYTIENGVVKMNYTTDKANDDTYDAFYALENLTVSADLAKQSVTLKRPFAQVNVAATDWAQAKASGYVVENTTLSFTEEVFTTFSLVDGKEGDAAKVTFTLNTLPDATGTGKDMQAAKITVAEKAYDHMAMAYILPARGARTLVNTVTFTYTAPDGQRDITINAVPVERNHRTNIIGRFFTSDVQHTIIIDENFDEPDHTVEIKAETPEDFKDALRSPVVSKIVVENTLDLSNLTSDDLQFSNSDKTIEMADDAQILLPADGAHLNVVDKNLTITGGTLTNVGTARSRANGDMVGVAKSLIHITNGVLTLDGVTLVNDLDHHYHGSTYNSSAISYWGNSEINISNCDIRSGMFAVCGMGRGGVNTSKVNLKDSYFESTSSSMQNGTAWAYCLRLFGSEGVLDNCEVKGVQGAVSTEEGTFTFKSGKYYTVNSSLGQDAFYAVYATNASKVIIEGGDFFAPNKRTGLDIQGTSCVASGDNDTGLPVGSFVEIRGGRFSGKAYVENRVCDEFNWVATTDPDNELIKWTVGAAE